MAEDDTNDIQVDESQSSGKVSLGLSVIMRVTLRDGTYHEVCLRYHPLFG
jgi:recombination DNA repair RAD52 pathway protein